MRVSTRKFLAIGGSLLLAVTAISGCTKTMPDEVNAEWGLLNPDAVNAESTSIEIGVRRTACASGFTGDIVATQVQDSAETLGIGISVEPLKNEAYNCQENETVPFTLELGGPIGQRTLTDLICQESKEPVPSCLDGAIRWEPASKTS